MSSPRPRGVTRPPAFTSSRHIPDHPAAGRARGPARRFYDVPVDQYGSGRRTNATLTTVFIAAGLAVVVAAVAVAWVVLASRPAQRSAGRAEAGASPSVSPSSGSGVTSGSCRFHSVTDNNPNR